MKRWIVTGGAGFIGSNLVRLMLEMFPEAEVTVLDLLTYAGHRISLSRAEETGRMRFVHGDVCDADLVMGLVRNEKPDVVLHLAAESHVDRSILGPAPFLRTNVDGTFRVLEAVRAQPGTRLVVVGTDEVYGSLGDAGLFHVDSPIRPSSPYSASKASADLLALAYAHTYGADVRVTRCSNNYGPFQMPEKLIPLMILCAAEDKPLPVYGDGLNVRDWIHVEDHARGILLAAKHGKPGRVYHFGGAAERTNLAVVHHILKTVGKPDTLIRYVQDRPGHDRRYAMDFSESERELNFRPTVTFEEGLTQTVRWYLENRDWCTRVQGEAHEAHMKQNYETRLKGAS